LIERISYRKRFRRLAPIAADQNVSRRLIHSLFSAQTGIYLFIGAREEIRRSLCVPLYVKLLKNWNQIARSEVSNEQSNFRRLVGVHVFESFCVFATDIAIKHGFKCEFFVEREFASDTNA
jgi:hypothetical protein